MQIHAASYEIKMLSGCGATYYWSTIRFITSDFWKSLEFQVEIPTCLQVIESVWKFKDGKIKAAQCGQPQM